MRIIRYERVTVLVGDRSRRISSALRDFAAHAIRCGQKYLKNREKNEKKNRPKYANVSGYVSSQDSRAVWTRRELPAVPDSFIDVDKYTLNKSYTVLSYVVDVKVSTWCIRRSIAINHS